MSTGSNSLKCALFGNDNGGYDKFVCFGNSSMVVSGVKNDYLIIGTNYFNSRGPYSNWKHNKSKDNVLNKWI